MSETIDRRICPVELAGGLDNSLRKLFQNPVKILSPFIRKGMTVLDLGCGPGFFTVAIAKMLNGAGKVIAADMQEGMLDKIRMKIKGMELDEMIELHKCQEDTVGVKEKVDFVLAFWMIHEVPDFENLFLELKSLLKTDGKILIAEPKFHVSKSSFSLMLDKVKSIGFEVSETPGIFISRAVLLKLKN